MVGLFGGNMEGMLANLSYLTLTSSAVAGTLTGTLTEVHEMMALLRSKKVRCVFFDRNYWHSRMPFDPMLARLKLLHACN
jgi:D-arabinose 1-dehydrogenase-like Zn-dependent alcohol dehydrogenase